MKKNNIVVLIMLLTVTGCNISNNTNSSSNLSTSKIENTSTKKYVNVKFDLNYDIENDLYLDYILFENQTLKEPEEPNRRDFVFGGWYKDEECKVKFEDFNTVIKDDLTLYASWSDYESLEDYEKINKFVEKIKKYSGNVSSATVVEEGIERYYTPMDQIFPFYQKIEYNRYQDITTADYYDEENNKFAEQQFFYDKNYFYNIFKDIENNGQDNSVRTAKFNDKNIESHLSIDMINLYGSLLVSLANQIKEGHNYDEMDYDFTFNYTHLDRYQINYSFILNYYTYYESVEVGSVEEIYMMEFGLTFVNGMIKKSKVVQQYMMGIQGEVQYAIEDTINTEYESVGQFENYNMDKFNPLDFM